MAVLARWRGNGLSTGNFGASTLGTGDVGTAYAVAGSTSTVTVAAGGSWFAPSGDPRIQIGQVIGNVCVAGFNMPSAITTWSLRCYVFFTASPTANVSFINGRNGSSSTWQIRRETNGRIDLRSASASIQRSVSTDLLVNSTLYRVEMRCHGGTLTARFFNGENTTALFELGGTYSGSDTDAIEFGVRYGNANLHGIHRFDDILITDTNEWLGPLDPQPEFFRLENGAWVAYRYEAVKGATDWDQKRLDTFHVHSGVPAAEYLDVDYTQGA